MRRLTLVIVVGAAATVTVIGLWTALGDSDGSRRSGRITVVAGDRTVAAASVDRLTASRARLARLLARVPSTRRERRGRSTITFETDTAALRRAVRRRLQRDGGVIRLPEHPVAASVRLPIVKQAFRNNCETAALSMMLAGRGVRVSQLRLQRELARSGPADPRPAPDGGPAMWGDPDRGFVGRVEGGGTSGGYGVYEGPILELAKQNDVQLTRISRTPAARVYRRLLAGRPVMVWVGLSDGPFETWVTPEGRRVTGNFGEHTVVLTGVKGSQLEVNDPLTGVRTTWGKEYFELLWQRLGRRALVA